MRHMGLIGVFYWAASLFSHAGLTLSFRDFRACWCAAWVNRWACWRIGGGRVALSTDDGVVLRSRRDGSFLAG